MQFSSKKEARNKVAVKRPAEGVAATEHYMSACEKSGRFTLSADALCEALPEALPEALSEPPAKRLKLSGIQGRAGQCLLERCIAYLSPPRPTRQKYDWLKFQTV